MRAAVTIEADGRRHLEVQDVATPEPGPGQILVRVRAAGLNRADLAMPLRHRAVGEASGPPIAGNEFAGEVIGMGPGVTGVGEGDRVMGFGASAFAEQTVVDHRHVLRVPDGMDWKQAVSFPTAVETMHDAIVTNGRLADGETVLVQGAASGVGIIGMQIARAKGAALVMGASRSGERLAGLGSLGMDEGVDISDPGWPDRVKALTDGNGVDLIIDMVSGATTNASMEAAAVRGRIVNVGRLGGMHGDFDFNLHALKRITYVGVTFRTRSDDEIAEIVSRAEADVGPMIADGRLDLPIHAAFPLEKIEEAYAEMRLDRHMGKIVITT